MKIALSLQSCFAKSCLALLFLSGFFKQISEQNKRVNIFALSDAITVNLHASVFTLLYF